MAFQEDHQGFLGDFGITATLVSQGRSVKAIFDHPNDTAPAGNLRVDINQPQITLVETDLVDVNDGDEIQISGQSYIAVFPPQVDGTGMAVLRLSEKQSSNPTQGDWR
jgi:hypothetical protein